MEVHDAMSAEEVVLKEQRATGPRTPSDSGPNCGERSAVQGPECLQGPGPDPLGLRKRSRKDDVERAAGRLLMVTSARMHIYDILSLTLLGCLV